VGDNTGVIAVVAAHNEAGRIGATLAALGDTFPEANVWVADDGSLDDTCATAEAAGAKVVRGDRRAGKGAAMTRAARAALVRAAPSEIALLCDGDLGESAARLGPLAQAVSEGRADLAVACFSKPVGGGFGVALGLARWAIRSCCGLEARAPLSGQRVVRASLLADLLPLAGGYGMEVGMTIDAVRAGASVREIDLDLAHRATGRTPDGFVHRGRQSIDIARAYLARR
jgi:glycosyltransferase involved in cell wall biosynthesis